MRNKAASSAKAAILQTFDDPRHFFPAMASRRYLHGTKRIAEVILHSGARRTL
jgi:hypothetical protein